MFWCRPKKRAYLQRISVSCQHVEKSTLCIKALLWSKSNGGFASVGKWDKVRPGHERENRMWWCLFLSVFALIKEVLWRLSSLSFTCLKSTHVHTCVWARTQRHSQRHSALIFVGKHKAPLRKTLTWWTRVNGTTQIVSRHERTFVFRKIDFLVFVVLEIVVAIKFYCLPRLPCNLK